MGMACRGYLSICLASIRYMNCHYYLKSSFSLAMNTCVLDGMDGKQARRTKSSSALGELFDHGVDSWASFLFPICIFSAISKTDGDGLSPMAMHLLMLSIYITFIDTHWEKYNTKVLFLPWAYDISMLVREITATIAFMQVYFLVYSS